MKSVSVLLCALVIVAAVAPVFSFDYVSLDNEEANPMQDQIDARADAIAESAAESRHEAQMDALIQTSLQADSEIEAEAQADAQAEKAEMIDTGKLAAMLRKASDALEAENSDAAQTDKLGELVSEIKKVRKNLHPRFKRLQQRIKASQRAQDDPPAANQPWDRESPMSGNSYALPSPPGSATPYTFLTPFSNVNPLSHAGAHAYGMSSHPHGYNHGAHPGLHYGNGFAWDAPHHYNPHYGHHFQGNGALFPYHIQLEQDAAASAGADAEAQTETETESEDSEN